MLRICDRGWGRVDIIGGRNDGATKRRCDETTSHQVLLVANSSMFGCATEREDRGVIGGGTKTPRLQSEGAICPPLRACRSETVAHPAPPLGCAGPRMRPAAERAGSHPGIPPVVASQSEPNVLRLGGLCSESKTTHTNTQKETHVCGSNCHKFSQP
jgi:hypothetical protein